MMIKIKIECEKFKYDIYNIFKLFFSELEFINTDDWDYKILIEENGLIISENCLKTAVEFDDKLTIKENIKKILYKYLSKKTGITPPWGTLVGIRPTKIALNLIKEGNSEEEILKRFKYHSLTREDKARLCIEVAKVEESLVNRENNNISVYVGMPFCPTRCLYCSFISDTISNCKDIVEDYLKALIYEIDAMAKYINDKKLNIECVYFGGGTPTSVDNQQFEFVMNKIYEALIKENNVKEFTVECGRPDSITAEKLNTLKKYGVHRISINPQTMNDKTLKLIGRGHDSKEVIGKFNMARNLGFDNINVDLIVGLPGEGKNEFIHTCDQILKLKPDSVTVHGMSLKRGSTLHKNTLNNIHMKVASQDELIAMHDVSVKLSEQLNLKPYYMYRQKNMVGNMENVGYAKSHKECLYNIEMIEERQTIIAIGANAVSKIIFLDEDRLERFPNIKDVREYINRIEEKVSSKIKFLDELYG
jgi:oxygen-independent coproporphyrinogen-3 oxidase